MSICWNVSSVISLLNISLRCADCMETETVFSVTVFFPSCDWTLLQCLCTSHPKENPKRRTPMIFKGTHFLNKHNLLKWNTWRMLHIACSCFLCRMGFSAEQLAKWVAERTDVHVGSFYFIFFRWIVLEMLVLFDKF